MDTDTGVITTNAQVEHMRRLTDIGRALTYTTSLEQVAHLTVERGAGLLDADAAVLMLSDREGILSVRATHGIAADRVTRFAAPIGDELIERLQGLLDIPGESFIAVPLVVGGAVSGLLAVGLHQAATAADEWLLSALADQAAVALENARVGGEVRLEMEDRLRVSEGATIAKDRALSTLAHDIRTPLGAIEGYCANIEDEIYGPINDRQRQALRRVRMSGRHLVSLLDNVMEMARVKAGVLKLSAERVCLADVGRDAVSMLAPAAAAKQQSLELTGVEDVVVIGDKARLRQVLINLLSNAVKFTPPEGSIGVSTARIEVAGAPRGEIRVTDSGPGIADEEQSAIYEPYYRSETTALIPGIGLGLAISQALVNQMGGELTLRSEVNVGSSFAVLLPLATPIRE